LLRSNASGGNGAVRHRSRLRARAWTSIAAAAALTVAGMTAAASASAHTVTPAPAAVHPHVTGHLHPVAGQDYAAACAAAKAMHFQCLALVRENVKQHLQPQARPDAAPTGDGYGPNTLQAAYNLTSASSSDGSGQTVAAVDAYNDPDITSDLATYRSAWGLPACGSGCFSVVNENGAASPLPSNAGTNGWDVEESLDVDMISAACPNCHIILVEANSASNSDLGTGVNAAVTLGAKYVSNSYGGSESSSDLTYDTEYYQHAGVAVTASAGDSDYGVEYPAASQYVTAVGGTSLSTASGSRGYTESVWNDGGGEGTGSGCSTVDPKPSWQTDTGCSKRTNNDVSADADPNTGLAVYDSYSEGGWLEVGGTSASSPFIAGTFALAGPPASGTYPSSYLYKNPSDLYDVTTGSNGTCSPAYLCTAEVGYDGPTGLGTPDGIGDFGSGGTTGNTVTVTNPGNQTGTVGTPASLQISATDSQSGQTLTYSATGLPAGLSISSTSGLITGTPTTAANYSVTVTATDSTGAKGTASFTWDISAATGNTVTVTNPGTQTGTVGTAVSLQIHATDSASGQTLTYSATGLPAGLSISTSGLITGTPTTAANYSVTVTATDTTGAKGSATFSWNISSSGGSCTSQQLIQNGGFSNGSLSPWTATSGVLASTSEGVPSYPTSDKYLAWLDGYGGAHTDTLQQTVTVPANCTAGTLTFWLYINSDDPTGKAYDTFTTQVVNSSGTVLATLGTLSNQNEGSGYVEHSYSLGNYAGQTITIKFTGKETLGSGYNTNFFEDDNALNVS
jgi:subtilase family serine protease